MKLNVLNDNKDLNNYCINASTHLRINSFTKLNGQLVSPFLIVYNVTGAEANGFYAYDIARIKEMPGKFPG